MAFKDFLEIWINAFLGLFAILNPIGNLGVFVDTTKDLTERERIRVFNLSAFVGFITLLILAFTGKWIMVNVFRITMSEFKIAGGVLLTIIGVQRLVTLKKWQGDHDHENVYELAVVPLAVPLLVGPGSIATAILIYDKDGPLVAVVSLVAVFAVTWGILQASPFLAKLFGKFGMMVASRILFIFITAIGVHFLLSGLSEYFSIPLKAVG